MEPCMHCCTIKTNHSARRWLFGYCMRLMPWEMLTIQYIWMGRGFSLMREDFRVCYELWTGGTAGPMVSASEFVRLEGSHKNRLYQRRHALILWAVEKDEGPALSWLERGDILLPIVVPINSFPPPRHKYKRVYSEVQMVTYKSLETCTSELSPATDYFNMQHSSIICYNNVDRLGQTQNDT